MYPIRTLEENIHHFHRAFSTSYIKDAFQKIKLSDDSSLLTIMHTPWGRYCWTLLSFSISSAPEEFQRRLHDILCGMDGVVNIHVILMYTPLWLCKLTRLNMVLVQLYFRLWTIPTE